MTHKEFFRFAGLCLVILSSLIIVTKLFSEAMSDVSFLPNFVLMVIGAGLLVLFRKK